MYHFYETITSFSQTMIVALHGKGQDRTERALTSNESFHLNKRWTSFWFCTLFLWWPFKKWICIASFSLNASRHGAWKSLKTNKTIEKYVFRLVTSVGQRKNSESPWGIEPKTCKFRAPMLYHWATETLRWARSITKFIWHASCLLLKSAVKKKSNKKNYHS